MSKEIKLEAGQWYRTRGRGIVYCVGRKPDQANQLYPWVICRDSGDNMSFLDNGRYSETIANHSYDLIEHLPDCTGFDWEPPKPIEPPEGWRLLNEGETISIDDLWFCGGKWSNFTFDEAVICGDKWTAKNALMARKIEPKYRAFVSLDEALPHCDGWLVNESGHKIRVDKVNKVGIGTYDGFFHFEHAICKFKKMDGTPFGVEVTE